MSEDIKNTVMKAWNRYITDHQRRYNKNEGSSSQHEDYCRIFKEGVINHRKLAKQEKEDILAEIGLHVKGKASS